MHQVVGSLPEKYGPYSVSICRWGVSCTCKGHFLVTLRPAVYIGPGEGCWSECGVEPRSLHLYLPSFHHLTPPWPLSEPRSSASLPEVPLMRPIFCHFIDLLISSWVFALFLLLTVNFLRTVSSIFSFCCSLLLIAHFSCHFVSFQKIYWTVILTQGTGSGLPILGMKISLMTNISRVDSGHKPRFWSQRAWLSNAPYWLNLSFFICTAGEVRVSTSYGYIIWIAIVAIVTITAILLPEDSREEEEVVLNRALD